MSGPTSIFRHKLVFNLLNRISPQKILEVGFGNGDLLLKMNKLGYKGLGIDFSSTAVEEFIKKTKGMPLTFSVRNCTAENLVPTEDRFDLVVACEVLEHIQEDTATLKTWNQLLTDSGHLLLSVPAHMKKWGHNDEYAGHIRRYEKEEVTKKLKEANFEVVQLYSYGYPFSNWAKLAANHSIKKKVKAEASLEERTKESGIHNFHFKFGKILLNNLTLHPFYLFQKAFLNADLGVGYVVLAKKKVSEIKSTPAGGRIRKSNRNSKHL